MSVLKTKVELEKRLAAAFPSTPIAYEGVAFTPPEAATYIYCQINRQRTIDPVFGSKYRREQLTFQTFVVTPYNIGTGSATTLAEQIRDLFPRGLMLPVDNLRIHVLDTPDVNGSMLYDNRIVVPVMVPVTVEVFN